MVEPLSFSLTISALVASAPHWLQALENTALSKGKNFLEEQAKQRLHDYLDEKKRQRQMELALKNAVESGLKNFHNNEERDQYRGVLQILSETNSEALRLEAMRLFTLYRNPDFTMLSEKYNLSQRISALAQHKIHKEIDATPYLKIFFEALLAELYNIPLFREQVSDVIQVRAAQGAMKGQRTLEDVLDVLAQIRGALAENYTEEQFKRDIEVYTAHVERTLHYLKLVGIVPKDRGDKNPDPEISGIFVPLRTAVQDRPLFIEEREGSIEALLEHSPYLVLLGGPGSGKSTATRHLAWSHAVANQGNVPPPGMRLLSGHPLPLRIELRRLTEDRRHHPNYSFLSYATEVLLAREGIEISPQMFRELLERGTMLVLFDGLDEVATLHERLGLVKEIEGFALQYPGNRILVTSRPVGYEFAHFSDQWFAHARVLEFDDHQIRSFLERWYTHKLQLSTIPYDEQQELETLLKTLKENPRLHKLAENPLLLTVITALHRYERLPDRRILVYDRCADLLLETWAKLRGTDVRWQGMKMGKEDQYACVAYLGFVLHERSQERESDNGDSKEDIASDVPTQFLLRKIEDFLEDLIAERAKHRTEAKRFLDLIQEEAGLIVERGSDEDGEALYGFVHRTFQEYFAAAHIYEQYQQETDTTILSTFLAENLHDPHWREVTLLLLGKLKRKPVTVQLRQILEGTIKSRRSKYTAILQQDLFFVCDCLKEEIAIENTLAESVVWLLTDVIKSSPFPSQRGEALNALIALIQTRQYGDLAQQALLALVSQDADARVEVATKALPTLGPAEQEKTQQIAKSLLQLAFQPDLAFEQSLHIVEAIYDYSPTGSEQLRQAALSFLTLLRRPELSLEQRLEGAEKFYWSSHNEAEHHQQAIHLLLDLARRPDSTIDMVLKIANIFSTYQGEFGLAYLEEGYEVTQLLLNLLQDDTRRGELPYFFPVNTSKFRLSSSEEQSRIIQVHLDLLHDPRLPFEQTIQVAQRLYGISSIGSEELREAKEFLFNLAQQPTLSFEQRLHILGSLCKDRFDELQVRQEASRLLLDLAQHPELTVDQIIQIAVILFRDPEGSDTRRRASQLLFDLTERPELALQDILRISEIFKRQRSEDSERQIAEIFRKYSNDQDAQIKIAEISSSDHPDDVNIWQQKAARFLINLAQRPGLSLEQTLQFIMGLSKIHLEDMQLRMHIFEVRAKLLLELIHRPDLSFEQALQIAEGLYEKMRYADQSQENKWIVQMLESLADNPNRSISEAVQLAQFLYETGDNKQKADNVIFKLAQRSSLSVKEKVLIIQNLQPANADEVEQWTQWMIQALLPLLQEPTLSFEQTLEIIEILYLLSYEAYSEELHEVSQKLWQLARDDNFTVDQRLQVARLPLGIPLSNYADRIQAVQIILSLLHGEDARRFFEEHWERVDSHVQIPVFDVPYIVELAMEKTLPGKVRDEMYGELQRLVPQFDKLDYPIS